MNQKLKDLYKEVILQYNKNPFNFQKKEDVSFQMEANNPLCGDRYDLYLEINNNTITNAHFHGYGCAISKASTSILTKNLIGKTKEEAVERCKEFINHVDNVNRKENAENLFSAFEAVDDFPERRSCAVLAWEGLKIQLTEK
ncbi:MAG: Fe-S cluster assembly sulfur transfer protein SufU [Saprospiraceae bacterium]